MMTIYSDTLESENEIISTLFSDTQSNNNMKNRINENDNTELKQLIDMDLRNIDSINWEIKTD